jgi:hypothetical protein
VEHWAEIRRMHFVEGFSIKGIARRTGRDRKTILDDYLRELRPILCPKRTYQRTTYRPGELAQFDLVEPRREIPVGHDIPAPPDPLGPG